METVLIETDSFFFDLVLSFYSEIGSDGILATYWSDWTGTTKSASSSCDLGSVLSMMLDASCS